MYNIHVHAPQEYNTLTDTTAWTGWSQLPGEHTITAGENPYVATVSESVSTGATANGSLGLNAAGLQASLGGSVLFQTSVTVTASATFPNPTVNDVYGNFVKLYLDTLSGNFTNYDCDGNTTMGSWNAIIPRSPFFNEETHVVTR
jgi:hypothetical protein